MYSLLDAIASVIVGGLVLLMVLTSLLNIQEQAYNTTMQVTTNKISEGVSSILQDYLSNVALNINPDVAIVHARKKSFRYWGMDYDDSTPIEYHIRQAAQDTTTGWWPLQVRIDGSQVMGNFYTEEKFIYDYYDADGNLIPFVGSNIPSADLPNIRSMRCELAFVQPGWDYVGHTSTIRNRIVFWKFFKNMYLDVD